MTASTYDAFSSGWNETITFLAGMISRDSLIDLIEVITKQYLEHHSIEDLNGLKKHTGSRLGGFNFGRAGSPFIEDILLAGKCIEEGGINTKDNDFLENVWWEYQQQKRYTNLITSLTNYGKKSED